MLENFANYIFVLEPQYIIISLYNKTLFDNIVYFNIFTIFLT